MSSQQASIIIPILAIFVIYAALHVNIFIAKRKIRKWKKGTTLFFIWSTGMGGIKRRALLVWMDRFGYDEAEAHMLASYQSLAILEAFVSSTLVMIISVNYIVR